MLKDELPNYSDFRLCIRGKNGEHLDHPERSDGEQINGLHKPVVCVLSFN
jgi:hypothetical protein